MIVVVVIPHRIPSGSLGELRHRRLPGAEAARRGISRRACCPCRDGGRTRCRHLVYTWRVEETYEFDDKSYATLAAAGIAWQA